MADYTKAVINVFRKNGWKFKRFAKGDHVIWESRDGSSSVSIDGKVKSRHSANEYFKHAGFKERF